MMQHAEKHGFLADEEYGSRKWKSAAVHATNKRLVTYLMRIMKLVGICVANEAFGCYDRILFLIAYYATHGDGRRGRNVCGERANVYDV